LVEPGVADDGAKATLAPPGEAKGPGAADLNDDPRRRPTGERNIARLRSRDRDDERTCPAGSPPTDAIESKQPGDQVVLTVVRDGQQRNVPVRLDAGE